MGKHMMRHVTLREDQKQRHKVQKHKESGCINGWRTLHGGRLHAYQSLMQPSGPSDSLQDEVRAIIMWTASKLARIIMIKISRYVCRL